VVINDKVTSSLGTLTTGTYTRKLIALNNGNFVITYPHLSSGGFEVGGITLFNGATGTEIQTMTELGSDHRMGAGFLIALANGNYAASSPFYSTNPADKHEGWIAVLSPTTGLVIIVYHLSSSIQC